MEYEKLTDEAKDVVKSMVKFCIEHGYCMGMDEGINLKTGKPHRFLYQLKKFVADTI